MNARNLRALAPLLMIGAQLYAADTWKVAGPPPASWQRDRVADLTAHRKAFMEYVGVDQMALLYAAEPRNYAGDVDWPYRQENNFYYLTGIAQEGSALVLIPGASVREILFLPPSNPAQETWTGHILTPDEARKISGIQEVWDARQLKPFLSRLFPQAATMLAEKPAAGGHGGRGPALPDPKPIPLDVAATFRNIIERAAQGEAVMMMTTRGVTEHQREIDLAAKLGALTPPVKVTDA